MTALEVRDLSVRFGGVQAVDNVSFSLDEGKILGIIGPNGAGKTTVFDAISGFVASTGSVQLAGAELSGHTPQARSRARLGRSFQDARLFPSLTVAETLAVALERHLKNQGVVSTAMSMPWVRSAERRVTARVDELVQLMGLEAFRNKFVAELSTGSRRIVDLAVILAHDPIVLLLDEPSSGIAQRETEALGPLLLRIREQTGASLLVIEHDMPLIRSVSDELLALQTGAVLTRGTPDEVLADPQLVAAYLGTDQAVLERSGVRSASPAASASEVAKERQARRQERRERRILRASLSTGEAGSTAPTPKAPARKSATKAPSKASPSRKVAAEASAKQTRKRAASSRSAASKIAASNGKRR